MKKIIVLFAIAIAICFICGNCEKPGGPTYYIPQELKDYVMFPKGSYWIFEDSLSGAIDSIYLIDYKTYIEEPNFHEKQEILEQTFYSSYWNNERKGGGELSSVGNPAVYSYGGIKGHYISSSDVGYKIDNQYYYLSYHDSLKVNNVWYKSVKCIVYYNKLNYWVKHIGPVKVEIPDSTNWILKKYHINW